MQEKVPVRPRHAFRLHVGGRSSTANRFCSSTNDDGVGISLAVGGLDFIQDRGSALLRSWSTREDDTGEDSTRENEDGDGDEDDDAVPATPDVKPAARTKVEILILIFERSTE
jgi:hypothetical protein